jgi:hypothetical protein
VDFLKAFLIELIQRVEIFALEVVGDSRRVGEIEDWFPFVAE